MRRGKRLKGQIIIDSGANVWHHELFIASALANSGYNVRFIPAHPTARSADAYVDNTIFEFKSPEGSSVRSIERNIAKALKYQSSNIVICTARMKNIQDRSVERFLITKLRDGKGIHRLLFVTRGGKVVDINKLIR